MDYKKAGVDIEAGYRSVELMKEHVKRTMREEVLGGLGGFSGAFSLAKIKEMEEPVLLSGTDGCGTKVKLAFLLDKHDKIGIDAVAMCVNDIACAGDIGCYNLGAQPPFEAQHTMGCMGASIGQLHGMSLAGLPENRVSIPFHCYTRSER